MNVLSSATVLEEEEDEEEEEEEEGGASCIRPSPTPKLSLGICNVDNTLANRVSSSPRSLLLFLSNDILGG